jgi:uncharacterized membrane-anchored protein
MLLAAALVLVLVFAGLMVRGYERTLAEGRLALFELAPVDPRSLMQGDFMALDFAVNREMAESWQARGGEEPSPRYALFRLDAEDRAAFVEFRKRLPASTGDQMGVRLHQEHGMPRIGPNAFFFQEGTGERYETAAWGEFRVAEDGLALLTGLRDDRLQRLGSAKR